MGGRIGSEVMGAMWDPGGIMKANQARLVDPRWHPLRQDEIAEIQNVVARTFVSGREGHAVPPAPWTTLRLLPGPPGGPTDIVVAFAKDADLLRATHGGISTDGLEKLLGDVLVVEPRPKVILVYSTHWQASAWEATKSRFASLHEDYGTAWKLVLVLDQDRFVTIAKS